MTIKKFIVAVIFLLVFPVIAVLILWSASKLWAESVIDWLGVEMSILTLLELNTRANTPMDKDQVHEYFVRVGRANGYAEHFCQILENRFIEAANIIGNLSVALGKNL